MKTALFGSAFNPPTLGHLDAIQYTLEQGYEQVWLVPSWQHAFGKAMLDYHLRLAMLQEFVSDIALENVSIYDVEPNIAQPGKPVYTWDVLNYLQSQYPAHQFGFVIGPDNQANWHKFHKASEIQARWQLVTVPERRAIRSTQVRNALASEAPITNLVTPSVREFIKTNQLYSKQTP